VHRPGQTQSYWTIHEQRALLEGGKRMESLHQRANRAVVAAGSGLRSSGAPPLPPPAAAPGARGRRVVGKSAREWYTVEESGAVMRGTVVTFGAGTPVVGTRAIVQLPDGSVVFARQFLPAEARAFFAQMPTAVAAGGDQAAVVQAPPTALAGAAAAGTAAVEDARVLKISYLAGVRRRNWSDVVDECEEEDFPDFPVPGPRTAGWCLQFLRRRHSPCDHHTYFRTVTRLGADAWGIQEHESIMKALEAGGQYDQMDLANLAMVEVMLRRAQLIEWVHHERVRDAEAGNQDRITPEEQAAFTGSSRAGESLMVAPSLLAHVKSVVEVDANIMKAVRKAKEERVLRRANPKKGGKGGDASASTS